MSQKDDKNRYALSVGHIALEWNLLEHDFQRIGGRYLAIDPEITMHIFAFMGNVSKRDFVQFLIERFEKNETARDYLLHFVNVFHRVRANRNIVEHGLPAITEGGAYLDKIIKISQRGDTMPYAASQTELDEFLKDLRSTRAFAKDIETALDKNGDFTGIQKIKMPRRFQTLPNQPD